jgi:predicted Zn finger-like uncharacterized protein
MKIVCDACQAKYSISDDKVQGKVFKIRCKKCSNIIVVRGNASAAEPAPAPAQEKDTRVYDYGYEGGDQPPAGDESVWHVVINQDQVGPMTAVDVQQRFAAGEIDGEAYIWREGFADWLPLAQVDTFAELVAQGSPTAAAPAGPSAGASAVAAMFAGGSEDGSGRSDPGDLFAAASAGAAQRDDDGGDLFGTKPAAAQGTQPSSKLRGERNENSVLFSLNNLAQLASNKPAPSPAPSSSSSSPSPAGAATGAAGGEGSGLIDIRSMASAYLGGAGAGQAKPVSAGIGSMDDLPVFGGGGFSEPAVIVPIAASRSNNNKLMYALIGSVGLLVVAAVVVVVVLLKSGSGGTNNAPPAQLASAADKAGAPSDKATEPGAGVKPAETKPTAPPTEPKPSDSTATDSKPADSKDGKTATNDASSDAKRQAPPPPRKTSTSTSAPPKSSKPSDKTAAAAPPPSKDAAAAKDTGGGCDEVSCVLNNYEGACCAKFKKGGGKPAGGGTGDRPAGGKGDLPDGLDRGMISEGVGKVKARVMACGDKSSAKGIVKVSVKVGADGNVTGVTVKQTPDAGLGDCVAGAMQKATFAKTQTGGSFAYPFTF